MSLRVPADIAREIAALKTLKEHTLDPAEPGAWIGKAIDHKVAFLEVYLAALEAEELLEDALHAVQVPDYAQVCLSASLRLGPALETHLDAVGDAARMGNKTASERLAED